MAWLLIAVLTQPMWIGTLEFTDAGGLTVSRVTATITITDSTIAGDWNSPGGASGSITGTVNNNGRIAATVTIAGGARLPDGTTTPERCRGEAKADGRLYSTVVRLSIPRIALDTPAQRVRNRHCDDLTRVVLLLQPFPH